MQTYTFYSIKRCRSDCWIRIWPIHGRISACSAACHRIPHINWATCDVSCFVIVTTIVFSVHSLGEHRRWTEDRPTTKVKEHVKGPLALWSRKGLTTMKASAWLEVHFHTWGIVSAGANPSTGENTRILHKGAIRPATGPTFNTTRWWYLRETYSKRTEISVSTRLPSRGEKKNFPRRFVSDVTAPCGSSGGYISENIRSPAAEHRGADVRTGHGHLLFFSFSVSGRSRKRFATREREKKIRKDWEMRLWAAPTSGMVSRRGSFWVCRTAEWAFPHPRTSVFNFSKRQEVKSLQKLCNE